MRTITRKSLFWAAPVALVAATGLAACGDSSGSEDSTRAVSPAAAAAGSDVHLVNLANDIAGEVEVPTDSDARIGDLSDYRAGRLESVAGSDVHLGNIADDIADRADTGYGGDVRLENLADDIADRAGDADSSSEFVAGSGHMPTR